MSQSGIINTSSGPVPPAVATSYTTDNGTAVPALNILDVRGIDVTDNNNNGVQVEGGAAETGAANRVQVQITNRVQGTGTTVGAVTADVVTFTPTTVGTYAFEVRVAAYNTTSLLGAGYSVFGSARYDGVNSNLCGTADVIDNEEGAMSSCDADFVVSGASMILRVTGYAAQTINWNAVGLYTFVGA